MSYEHSSTLRTPPRDEREILEELIKALREELKAQGEMLARFEELQRHCHFRAVEATLSTVSALREQSQLLLQVREQRRSAQRDLVRQLLLPEAVDGSELVCRVPKNHQPLLAALMGEALRLQLILEGLSAVYHPGPSCSQRTRETGASSEN